jgi:hypothetical protein
VTKANEASRGSPRRSITQAPATSSIAAAAGVGLARPAFWSHAATIQSAASATGSVPPMTKPKKRGEPIAMIPGSASSTSSSSTVRASTGSSGSASRRAARAAGASRLAATGRSGRDSR